MYKIRQFSWGLIALMWVPYKPPEDQFKAMTDAKYDILLHLKV
jgi:hypothetical protein